jgi:DNA-binding IclR family transcriptional regulator
VDRAIDVLTILGRDGELAMTQIAAELGVHKSTAFRIVATLEHHNLVEQVLESGRFRLGNGVLRFAAATAFRLDLVQASRAVTSRLAVDTGEVVNVTTLAGHHALYLDQVAGSSAEQLRNYVGRRFPLHATSNGKVLLAHVDDARREALTAPPLEAFTPRTVTDVEELRRQLDVVRARGYATAVDELEIGLAAVAAPVIDRDGAVAGSISMSGPTSQLSPTRLAELARLVTAAAAEVSARLGRTGTPFPAAPEHPA